MTRVLTGSVDAATTLVSTVPPVEASGQVMLVPFLIGFLAAFPAAWFAVATTRPLAPVVPLLAAYAHHRGEPGYVDRAIALLEQLPAEKNRLTDGWDALGLGVRTAFDSQASIELYNEFCSVKKCLSCQIGAGLLKG